MTIHIVDIEHVLHICPANPEPHIVDTRHTLVHTNDGGPCRAPVTIQASWWMRQQAVDRSPIAGGEGKSALICRRADVGGSRRRGISLGVGLARGWYP